MRKIKKSFEQKREELRQALYRLEGAIKRYKVEGEIAELGTVAMELRGLVCGDALLINLAENKGFSLELYTIPTEAINEMSQGEPSPTIWWAGDSVSLESKLPWTQKISIKEWLKTPIAESKGSQITAMRLINEIASSVGPAHYPPDVSSSFAEMSEYNFGGIPSQFRTLVNFSDVVLELGYKFLASFREHQ